jgi:hypothetical protein
MKKVLIIAFMIAIIIGVIVFVVIHNNTANENITNAVVSTNIVNENKVENIVNENKVENMEVYIKVNDRVLSVELEENLAAKELKEKIKNGDIVVKTSEYGGFEKVGSLGFSLPREDKNITTSAGDIVLYQGNQISIFYESNSWSYTKLGKIKGVTAEELKKILGSGDVSITFTNNK